MQLNAEVVIQPRQPIGELAGSLQFHSDGLAVDCRYDFVVSGFNIFDLENSVQEIEVSRNGEVICRMRGPEIITLEEDQPEEAKALQAILLLGVTEGLEHFADLLMLMQFDGTPFATSPDLSSKEATWLILSIIVGKKEFAVNLDACQCDQEDLLALFRG